MITIKTPIIPSKQTFAKVEGPHELHLEAICVFAAIGFFLDQDTYWKDQVVLRPGSNHTLDDKGLLLHSEPWFRWHSAPRAIALDQALDEFSQLFETVIAEQTQGNKVILPLSGGLDSRTQAAALKTLEREVLSYSYAYEDGFDEIKIAKQVAKVCDFNFKAFTIPKGYLWHNLERLAELNQCYSEFTAPRQMAIFDDFDLMEGVFSLGHWGDVLFDDMQVNDHLTLSQQTETVIKKLVKRSGLELANRLWKHWGLEGDFSSYFYERIKTLLLEIDIDHSANARIRAFKSLHWAPRWTSVNLSVFQAKHPITLPYYDDRLCEFICTLPEAYLKGRQLQIGYLKRNSPELAKIMWQQYKPFNLYSYHKNKLPYNLPYRSFNKVKRMVKASMGHPYMERSWELQFLGKPNDEHLKAYLFNNDNSEFIPEDLISYFYKAFKTQPLNYAHSVSMLLTLKLCDPINLKYNA